MTDLTLPTPECFKPLAQPSRYKAAYGGRGSGKSWHFASMIVEHCLLNPGAVCIREVQKTLNQSAKALIELKIQEFGVGAQFRVLYDRIETPGNGRIIFQGMQDMNDEQRSVGLGPSHDWSSHAADAFGLMAISYEDPARNANFHRAINYPKMGVV